MITRNLKKELQKSLSKGKSILLLGPRQTGKSTLSAELKIDLRFNLANEAVFLDFAKDPNYLESELRLGLKNRSGVIFIDEVQRLPRLLNTIQTIVDDSKSIQFILTGSSARKLRRGQANLLPGRLHVYDLGPIISSECDYKLDTQKILSFGSLPEVIEESDELSIKKLLKSYTLTYLNEEIKAEALTKNIEGFTRFLFLLATDATKYLDLTKISKNVGVPRQTVQRYFEILEDTLIVHRAEAYAKSEKRRLTQHPRFFFFDNGVVNALLNNFKVSADRKGFLFENLFFNQLKTSLSYSQLEYRISNYRTDAGAEIDFILELEDEVYAIEVKSGAFGQKDLTGFESFQSFLGKNKKFHRIIVIPDGSKKLMGEVRVLPWQDFLRELKV